MSIFSQMCFRIRSKLVPKFAKIHQNQNSGPSKFSTIQFSCLKIEPKLKRKIWLAGKFPHRVNSNAPLVRRLLIARTVIWIDSDFSATQILREINFVSKTSYVQNHTIVKMSILDFLGSQEIVPHKILLLDKIIVIWYFNYSK